MSDIKDWSTTAADNDSPAPNGFPEGMAPGDVNDAAREVMRAVRTWYEAMGWHDLGDTPTYATATTFTITGDVTAQYSVNRRIRCTDATVLYGYISASSYGAPNTTVTVVLDTGSLSGSLSAVALGALGGDSTPNTHDKNQTIDSSAPAWVLVESDATADNGVWAIKADSEQLQIQLLNDDLDTAAAALTITRTGITVDAISFGQDISVDSIVQPKVKIVNIGDWDMDGTASVAVPHGLTYADIRDVHVMIRNDIDTSPTPLDYNPGTGNAGYWSYGTNSVVLTRVPAGQYDSTNYDATSYNRGWITIFYV